MKRFSRKLPVLAGLCVAWFTASNDPRVLGQTVQLPNVGTFSISTSVAVPDQGTMSLGGSGSNGYGSAMRGGMLPNRAIGNSSVSTQAAASAIVINLDELDRMIRSQAVTKPTTPNLLADKRDAQRHTNKNKATQGQAAGYDYLLALSGGSDELTTDAIDDVRHYLELAEVARKQGHWAAVELYYKMAWKHLPESRRESVLKTLVAAKSQPADEPNSKGNSSTTKPTTTR